jgi:LysM repeat protein
MHVKQSALGVAVVVALVLPATAAADYAHVVEPGESLTSVAAIDGLSVSALAAANGLSSQAELQVGQVIQIPPLGSSAPRSTLAGSTAGRVTGEYVVRLGDTLSAIAARSGTSPARLAALNGLSLNGILLAGRKLTLPGGGSGTTTDISTDSEASGGGFYIVRLGDTLSAIAARSGTTVAHLAAINGLDPSRVLVAGRTLTLGSQSSAASDVSSSGSATGPGNQQITGDTSDGPYPTDEYVSSSEVGAEAADDGLSPSLAEAIGWQESGYDNDVVSPTGAVGVMQIEPATWAWINGELTPSAPLDPSSATDNVRGGVLLLHDLVSETGSDSEAAAAYYQGLQSVEDHGEFASTQQYVADIAALQARFGG